MTDGEGRYGDVLIMNMHTIAAVVTCEQLPLRFAPRVDPAAFLPSRVLHC